MFVMLATLGGKFDDELLANTEKTLVKVVANATVIFFSWFIFKILPHCLHAYGNPIMTSNAITYNYYFGIISFVLIYYRIS